jgi:hypothetical protein
MFSISSDNISGIITISDTFNSTNAPVFIKSGDTYALSFINLKNVKSFKTFNYTTTGTNDYRYLTAEYRISRDNRSWSQWYTLSQSINNFPAFDSKYEMFIDIKWTRNGESSTGIISLSSYNLSGLVNRAFAANENYVSNPTNNSSCTK